MTGRMYSHAASLSGAALLTVWGLATPVVEAQSCIDFETVPGVGTPTEGLQITTQYEPAFHVIFSSLVGGLPGPPPTIVRVGPPRAGFAGSYTTRAQCGVNSPTNDDMLVAGEPGDCLFLTTANLPGLPGDLVVQYTQRVTRVSGIVFDIDFSEQWTITARDQNGVTVGQPLVLTAGDPSTGNGIATPWQFDVGPAQIDSLLFQYTGTSGGVGLGFDNFCPASLPGCTEPPPDMVAWWPLDETEGTTAEDTIGDHHGTYVNNPTPAVGKVGVALEFDRGSGDYVEVPDHPALNFGTGDFSIDAWIFLRQGGVAWYPIVNKTDRPAISAGYEFMVTGQDRTLRLVVAGGGSQTTYTSVEAVPTRVWTHVAVTFSHQCSPQPACCPQPQGCDMSFARFYINGLGGDSALSDFPGNVDNSFPLAIGAGWMGEYFKGGIDEVEVFDRVLDPAEILAIYQAGSAGKCKCPCGDLDGDGDVDLEDFARFQGCFAGPLP